MILKLNFIALDLEMLDKKVKRRKLDTLNF